MPARRLLSKYAPLLYDGAAAGLAAATSVVLRVGFDYSADPWGFVANVAVLFALTAVPTFWLTGSYRAAWRFVSTRDVLTLARASVIANALFLLALFLLTRLDALPRSFVIINTLVLLAFLLGPRLITRLASEGHLAFEPLDASGARHVLVIGAGADADLFLRALEGQRIKPWRVEGLLAAGITPGARLRGVPVLGGLDDLDDALEDLAATGVRIEQVIVAEGGLEPASLAGLAAATARRGLVLSRTPRPDEWAGGAPRARPIAIEDLLGRPEAKLDIAPVADLVRGRRVAITGAGGSIGSELARQIAALGPAHVVLLDQSELALYEIDAVLARVAPDLARTALMIDVRDRARVAQVFAQTRPDLVFHAAALKHVPLVEANRLEAAATNILGTLNVADAARQVGALAMVLISSDKAVNPSSFMGATKRAAEIYAQALDREGGATRFVTVRFGNVLGSTGSVVPLFKRQIEQGGPITITHPDMRRYFMTIAEAVSLVLQASASAMTAARDEAGAIHVLDMGAQMRIVDLARAMIRLAGFEPDRDIAITFTGLRPGEKLEEELFHDAEAMVATPVPGVHRARPRLEEDGAIAQAMSALRVAIGGLDEAQAVAAVRALVPEWHEAGP